MRIFPLLLLLLCLAACAGQQAPAPKAPVARKVKAPPAAAPGWVGIWDVRWHRLRSGWRPPTLVARLRIERKGDGLSVAYDSPVVGSPLTTSKLTVRGDRLEATFHHPESKLDQWMWATVGKDSIVGEMRTEKIGWTPFFARRLDLKPSEAKRSLPRGTVASAGLDPKALDALVDRAAMERSSALVIIKDGKIIVDRHREGADKPIVAMSASKSVVSMAVGHLIASGKLKLDTPMKALFKEWRRDPRGKITVRHLLSQTSGLELKRSYADKKSITEYTLSAKLQHPPGTVWKYSNGGVDFLAAVVKRASGEHLDAYLEQHLFKPMGIEGARWYKDKAGMPTAAGELVIRPYDLAALGQLMLDGGKWKGQQLLPASWVAESTAAALPMRQDYGLLWWRVGDFTWRLTDRVLKVWAREGAPAAALEKLRPLLGEAFAGNKEYWPAVEKALGKEAANALIKALRKKTGHATPVDAMEAGPVHGFAARGWKGQVLVVLPKAKLVAVRMRWSEGVDSQWSTIDSYRDFERDVLKLVGHSSN